MKDLYRVGIDVGSTTAKIAVLDQDNRMVYSRYERHNAKVAELVSEYLNDIAGKLGDIRLSLCVTGSVGMSTAEQLGAAFVQEVVAATVFARNRYPEAKALIDIGGEDAKVVFFNGKSMELRMNGNCAGGTGAFIDQMSVLMGCSNQQMNDLAMKSTHLYPMAARCGVFAKTDIQNLMSRNLPESDIAASIFHSIAVQTVTTLSHGCDFSAPILLCGGPLTFLPALRKAFADYLQLSLDDFIVLKEGNLIPALGCAIRAAAADEAHTTTLSALIRHFSDAIAHKPQHDAEPASATTSCNASCSTTCANDDASSSANEDDELQPLFTSDADHQAWLNDKAQYATPVYPMEAGDEYVTIGIDSGSTTTKIIAVRARGDRKGQIIFTDYSMNLGNPIHAAEEGLKRLKAKAADAGATLHIVGSCSTGYGEELIKAAFGLDQGIIETMAHYRAAARLMPQVSFILDIGGQDMKAIFVDHGAVTRMELNEACSSGCGTFIQTFARGLGYKIDDFARLACEADKPCDLGTRCTVFMNSKVKQVLREGATIQDIAAGLSYSVVRNCLYKVLKLRGNDDLGGHIVVQGGTMKNDSVVRAFELLTDTRVARSNIPEMMGAYGCALHSIATADSATEATADKTDAADKTIDDLLAMSAYDTRQLNCKGCENHCFVTMYKFAGGRRFYSGNKCERVFTNKGKHDVKGENIYPFKYHLLFDRADEPQPAESKPVVAIPRVLNMYEDFPFWHALFTTAGFDVRLSKESTFRSYETALGTVMSDNICFPAKLVHSHVKELDEELSLLPDSVERFIFMPYVVFEHQDDSRNINSYNCPIVSAYSDVIRSAMKLNNEVVSPVINFRDEKLLRKQIDTFLHTYGVKRSLRKAAYEAAVKAQNDYVAAVHQKDVEILAESRREHHLTILLAGRPYHTDPLIQHKLSEMIAALGVNVISDDIVRGDMQTGTGETYLVRQWAYMNRIIKSGQWCAQQPDDVHFVQMTSFGCGPDSFIQDEIRSIMKDHGKPYTLLKIDDVSNIGSLKLRVRSLIESLSADSGNRRTTTEAEHQLAPTAAPGAQYNRKILAPYFTEYLTPLLPPLCRLIGWDVEVLPPSDQESAELGLKYANNEVCYPATLIVGDFVKALRSGRYDPTKVAAVMSQTGGQCRATNYAALIRRAMNANGFNDVPLITLGVSPNASEDKEQSEALDVPWMKMAPIIATTLLYGDVISKFYHGAVSRLKKDAYIIGGKFANKAEELRDKYLTAAAKPISENNPAGLMDLISKGAAEFDAITADKEVPAVGIVGEIFLKFNPFAHQFLAKKIIDHGCEVVPPLLTPFFLQDFVNVIVQKHMGLKCTNVPDFLVKSIYSLIWRREQKMNRLASRFRYFRPFTNIFDDAKEVNGVVSLAAQFGEGWLLPSDVISMVKQGVNNVASLQPFGCIANHIISKGIEKKLKERFPQLNLVSLDFDSGVSAVNVTNRLLLFLDSIA